MQVVKVFFDSCDSWTINTRRLETIAVNDEAAYRFIAEKENKTVEKVKELMSGHWPYWSIETVEVYE